MAETDIVNPPLPSPTPTDTADTDTNSSWHSILVVEGVRTADRREFSPNSLRWRALPLPLLMQLQTAERHQGSVVVGRIERIERQDNGEIHGWGTFDMGSQNGKEAQRLVSEQIMRGVSIDGEVMEIDKERLFAEEDGEVALIVEEGRIMGATIVPFPAFPQAVIALADADIPTSTEDGRGEATAFKTLTDQDKAICINECKGDRDCISACMEKKAKMYQAATAVSDAPWNFIPADYADDEYIFAAAASRSPELPVRSNCFLIHHERTGELNRQALDIAAREFNQVNATPAALSLARTHLLEHYHQISKDPPRSLTQLALVAHAEQQGPPASWFTNPELKAVTPLTIARNGRIYGHVADWTSCHTGFRNECMTPPRSRTNYAHFLLGSTFPSDCDCDEAIATGPIVLSTTHANQYATADGARHHYDNTGQAVADVVVGEDAYGIWVAGSLRPGVSDAQIRALRGSSLSGDWRYIGGNMELIGILAVNTPGFPIPRVSAGIEGGIQVSLVAAGIPQDTREPDDTPTGSDPADILEQLKREQQQKVNGTGDEPSQPDDEQSEPVPDSEPGDDSPPAPTPDTNTDTDSDPDATPPAPTPETPSTSASDLLHQLKTATPVTT